MKKFIFSSATILFSTLLFAQTPNQQNNPYPKTITVSGSAEMEIIPDEIFVNITLQEYQKKGESKRDIETIKADFLHSCNAAGIADSLISIESYSGYNDYFGMKRNKKKQSDLQASVTYQVKFKSSGLMDALVEKLDDEATKNFRIVSTSHSKMTEFRKELKTRAIQAARGKGIYLTEAIHERLGEAITINEPGELQDYSFLNNAGGNAVYTNFLTSYRDQATNDEDGQQKVDFKKLKLRFDISVVFALK